MEEGKDNGNRINYTGSAQREARWGSGQAKQLFSEQTLPAVVIK